MSEEVASEELTFTEVLDELEYFLTNGRKVPLTGNVIVNEEDILELVDRIRGTLPEEVVKAREVVHSRKEILDATHTEASEHRAHANDEAIAVVAKAKERAEELVSEHTILIEAKNRASVTIHEAEERAKLVSDEADHYAAAVMETLEEQLTKTLTTVRHGIDSLPAAKVHKKRRGDRHGHDDAV